MITCAVFVTYADRSALCIRAADAALTEGIQRVIIVDNGSAAASAAALRQFATRHHPLVTIVSLPENTGSARGFGAGIEAFLRSDADIIWLLDDDNLIATGAAAKMTEAWVRVPETGHAQTALAAFRVERYNYVAALDSGDAGKMLPPVNAYDGFHLKKLIAFAARSGKRSRNRSPAETSVNSLAVPVAAYGGLWMHRSLCAKAALPDADYVLYMDDFDYTWRLTASGVRILLLRDVVVTEIEPSYYLPAARSWKYHSLLAARSDALAYYTCRNVVFFTGKYLVTRPGIYRLNRRIFRLAITTLAILNSQRQRLKVIFQAMRDGEQGRLGPHPSFPIWEKNSQSAIK